MIAKLIRCLDCINNPRLKYWKNKSEVLDNIKELNKLKDFK